MPTFPDANTVRNVEVAVPAVVDAMVRSGVLAGVLGLFKMERSEYGEVVPMPTLPLEMMRIFSVSAPPFKVRNAISPDAVLAVWSVFTPIISDVEVAEPLVRS